MLLTYYSCPLTAIAFKKVSSEQCFRYNEKKKGERKIKERNYTAESNRVTKRQSVKKTKG